MYNLFTKKEHNHGMIYDTFKKTFFPQFYIIPEGKEDEDEHKAHLMRQLLNQPNSTQEKVMQLDHRIRELDHRIKKELAGSSNSVRKMFLRLDSNNKGFITVDDIFKSLGHCDIDFEDLKKLITDKDSKKQGKLSF